MFIDKRLLGQWLLCLMLVFFASELTSQTSSNKKLSLEQVLDDKNLHLQFDPLTQSLTFSRGLDFLVHRPGNPWAIKNGVELVVFPPDAVDEEQGQISEQALAILEQVFPKPIASSRKGIKTIFIDPGHGGKDPGAIGRFTVNGSTLTLNEKDIVLDVGKLLLANLQKRYPDRNIVMSRYSDQYLPLDERTKIANRYAKSRDDNTLFVSLHANASLNSKARGFEIWYLPPEYRRSLIQEDDYTIADKSVLPIINTLIEEEYTVSSILLAQSVLRNIEKSIANRSPNRGIKAEEWYVVRSARMPSILIELGFITNSDEFNLLRTADYLKNLADGIYNGIVSYIDENDAHFP